MSDGTTPSETQATPAEQPATEHLPLVLPGQLPDCHALIGQLSATVIEQLARLASKDREIAELTLAITELIRREFMRRSERYLQDPNQLLLDFGGTPDIVDAAAGLAEAIVESQPEPELPAAPAKRRKKRKPNYHAGLPAHLPRREVELPVADADRLCPTHGERRRIGEDRRERAMFKPPEVWVLVSIIPKFACVGHAECGVGSPERPPGLVEGDRYDTSIAAEVIAQKYFFHQPIYRQQDLFARAGWAPSRSTLLNILVASAGLTRPLTAHFQSLVIASGVFGTDDTRLTLLLGQEPPSLIVGDRRSERMHQVFREAREKERPSVTARMWAYRAIELPLNVFDFTVSRHRDGPETFLDGFTGTLLGDCYAGYEGIVVGSDGRIVRAACTAHARRKVYEARNTYPLESSLLLSQFQRLYDIESRARTMPAADRLALRRAESAPIWDAMGAWLADRAAARVLPKSDFGKALTYLRNQWVPLRAHLNDGRLPSDNNEVEQLMKQVALGRKNWLFSGSVAAGQRAADFLTLVSSAWRCDLDVWAYIKDVLDRLLAGDKDYDAMRPDVWGVAHPESIRDYRREERRERAERKERRRHERRAVGSSVQ